MNFPAQKKSSWPRQTAIVVSDSPNVHMLLRELLRSYNWTVIDATASIDRAVSALRGGQAFLVITDDTIALPVVRHVRHLLSDPIAICTPVLSFLLETHKSETAALSRLGRPQIVDKPLTPSKFVPGFVQLVRNWEREPLAALRRANYQFLNGNDAVGLRALFKLLEEEATQPFAAQALAVHLRRLGKVKEAEAILLATLKKAPRDLGTMTALADLYMHAAMPKLSHRLLAGARQAYNQSHVMMPDLVQSALLMGDVDDAIGNLYIMLRGGYMEEEVAGFLARLLFAEGREAEAERVLNTNRGLLKKIQSAWASADASSQNAAPAAAS